MNGNNSFFIISVSLDTKTKAQNDFTNAIFREQLYKAQIPFKSVEGSYKGFKESGYVLHAKYENEVLKAAKTYLQESVLFVDNYSNASLIYTENGNLVKLGKFTNVPRNEALQEDSYTYDSSLDEYYIVK